jgi:hypothetical protein
MDSGFLERTHLIKDPGSMGHFFRAGNDREGRQVIMGILDDEIVAVIFDSHGRLLAVETRSPNIKPDSTLRESNPGAYWTHVYEVFLPSAEATLRELQEKSGFVPGVIRIQEFSVPNRRISVQLMPDFLNEFLSDPQSHAENDEDAQEYYEIIEAFKSFDQFVFRWGKEFWMSRDGDIQST